MNDLAKLGINYVGWCQALSAAPAPNTYFLKGGYKTFYSEYLECYMNIKPISQEKVETERSLISQCGKWHWTSPLGGFWAGRPSCSPFILNPESAYYASTCDVLTNTARLNVSVRTSEACPARLCY